MPSAGFRRLAAALADKGIDPACRRCGRDEWEPRSDGAFVPNVDSPNAGGTAATIRVCSYCGIVELYSPGFLESQRTG